MPKISGIFVGRLCPIHFGHEAIIRNMLEQCGDSKNCLVVIGSSNSPISLRHFFSYSERRDFILKIFPKITIVGLPDYSSDQEWLMALDDIIGASHLKDSKITFFGGCEEDVRFFIEAQRNVFLLNRFDGSTPKISATEVRDALIHERPLEALVNSQAQQIIRETFVRKWERFKKM